MDVFLLDANVIVSLAQLDGLDVLTPSGSVRCEAVEEVFDEVTSLTRDQRRTLETHVAMRRVLLGTPEEQLFVRLRGVPGTRTKNVGEDATIAWAFTQPDTTFVTNDRQAASEAMTHLGGRTSTLLGMVRRMVLAAHLADDRGEAIARGLLGLRDAPKTVPLWL